ncbi:hypothetical protein VNO77_17190 [Canavalia gladiata]|uniref:Uncharacterized protein n=1 Tax=Canavalia gladiata TaxID=3824 RepID=A0AAN9LIL8_CANGL
MDTATVVDAKVQHVTKKSSDELLRKFAEMGSDDAEKKKRRKKRRELQFECDSPSNGGSAVVERRSLLPSKVTRRSVLLRQLRAKDMIKNKPSLFGTIHKTWRRTVESASRVFIEKHYHRHKRLINDIV